MYQSKKTYDDLPGWTFEVDEVSAGVFRVKADHDDGRRAELTETDARIALQRCRSYVLAMEKRRHDCDDR